MLLAAELCLTLCDPMDYSPPGSSARGILRARILEWIAISSPGDLPDPGIKPGSPALPADSLLYLSHDGMKSSHVPKYAEVKDGLRGK